MVHETQYFCRAVLFNPESRILRTDAPLEDILRDAAKCATDETKSSK